MVKRESISIYLRSGTLSWIDKNPLEHSRCASVSTAAEWGILQLRRGARSAFKKLDDDERGAVIYGISNLVWDFTQQSTESLVSHYEEWFEVDFGRYLEWDEVMIGSLLNKLKTLNSSEVAGLICWAKGYWSEREKKPDLQIGDYANDLSRLV